MGGGGICCLREGVGVVVNIAVPFKRGETKIMGNILQEICRFLCGIFLTTKDTKNFFPLPSLESA